MRKYKTLILSGKGYPVYAFTPLITKRIITTLRSVKVSELKDIPDGAQLCAKAISFAIAGSGLFSQSRAFFIRRRLLRQATLNELIEGLQVVIEMIPANEYYTISLITNQFNKLVSK